MLMWNKILRIKNDDLALKWNNIYWIETVTPNSGSLFPTTYNLKVNHSNNIISLFTTLT